MTARTFFNALPQFLVLFPSAASCYFSAAHQMRFSVRKTALLCAAVLIPFSLIGAWLCGAYGVDMNLFGLPALVLFYFLYRQTVTVSAPKALAIYVGVCTVQTFPAQFAYALDAHLHPDSGAASFSCGAALFQLALSCLVVAAAAYPAIGLLSHLVDALDTPSIWYTIACISSIFLILNMLCIPQSYQTLYAGRLYFLFIALETGGVALLAAIYFLFYRISAILMDWSALKERAYLLETQARQYGALRTHLRETARLRHDFRHSVHLLAGLAQKGDLDKLRAHLTEYEGKLAERAPVNYCANDALNALFGYYKASADEAHIRTDWRLELPDPLCYSELDLAALFGNLLENAIAGCRRAPEDRRYFFLASQVRRDGTLYIVSTNSFDGTVLKGRDGYLSTTHAGPGLGLASIEAVAEKYHGSARFSHNGTEFFVDVALRELKE